MTIEDIRILQQTRDADLEPAESIPSVIVEVGGSVHVAGRPGFIWVSEFGQAESLDRVLNTATGVQPIAGNLCQLGLPNQTGVRQVLRIYDDYESYFTDEDDLEALTSPPHHQAHEYPSESNPGPDPVLVYQPALQALKVTGDGATLTVTVRALDAYRSVNTPKSFPDTTLDLTSSVPAVAGERRYTLVYLNAQTNALAVVDGTAGPSAITPAFPALPDHGIAAAYVDLTNAQSSITTVTHVRDAREFLEPRQSNTSAITATAIGQILISHDGLTMELGIPVVDANGDIITDANGHIITV